MSFNKGEAAFQEEMDRLVREMLEDGTIAELSDKWFGPGEDVTDGILEIIEQ
jgi:ABC-type amino acid transport substrate-binding protein